MAGYFGLLNAGLAAFTPFPDFLTILAVAAGAVGLFAILATRGVGMEYDFRRYLALEAFLKTN